MMIVDVHQDNNEDEDDNDRTEIYTPPPLDTTNDLNNRDEQENVHDRSRNSIKQQSFILLDDSFDQATTTNEPANEPTHNYWDQWPLADSGLHDEEHLKLYSIPDIDIPPSPLRQIILSPIDQTSTTTEKKIFDLLNLPPLLSTSTKTSNSERKKPSTKRKRKKKPMCEYRPPSPFSPKPYYKSMAIEELKSHATLYGLSTTQAKGRLIKILDEIYNFTHQYETDTDYEFDTNDISHGKSCSNKKSISHTPPTPTIISQVKKPKQHKAVHQMSSSDENDDNPLPPPSSVKKQCPIAILDNDDDDNNRSDEYDTDHEGRFLELTVYDLSSTTTSSSSLSIVDTPPTNLPSNDGHFSGSSKLYIENCSQAKKPIKSKSKAKPSTPTLSSDSDAIPTKKLQKKPKLQTPTIPLKQIVRTYIESNSSLHARILCYEPIDFEEFHKQIKTDLNIRIASKELMHCLDDQCITFTLRSRKGAFTNVMRAKRRHQ
ncbi:unnamed protein product [Rotaria socialis]|uniref:Structure-specific endonuclease subunit SLX4 n=1 Tax=Rotaria socialis TaxID=392032 RepID=A0A817UZ84_9BILA|nr:unnamed protein product [Rotaria socialis]CAF4498784.1 unnamed protein product [Rotaria socialis]